MDGHGLVTFPLFFHVHDTVRCDGWMDGMHGMDAWIGGWSWPCHLSPSFHLHDMHGLVTFPLLFPLHDIVRCDGWMDGWVGSWPCHLPLTLYTEHNTLYSVQCTLYTLHRIVYSLQNTMYGMKGRWMMVTALSPFHYSFIFMTLLDVMDGMHGMDAWLCGWS